jgi:hypothetical protein
MSMPHSRKLWGARGRGSARSLDVYPRAGRQAVFDDVEAGDVVQVRAAFTYACLQGCAGKDAWSVFSQFVELVSDASGWAYGIVFLLALLDVLVPVVPSEASVITAGVVASTGGISLP